MSARIRQKMAQIGGSSHIYCHSRWSGSSNLCHKSTQLTTFCQQKPKKIEIFDIIIQSQTQKSSFAKLAPVFWPFCGSKSRFLDFFKVVLELFRNCLGIVFDRKSPNFLCIFRPTLYSMVPVNDLRLRDPAKPQ